MFLSQGQSPRLPADSIDHLRSDPQGTAQGMPAPSATHALSSPHLAGSELAASLGGNTASGASPDGLPGQTIFPGIVHETVRRGSMLAQAACDKQKDGLNGTE